MSVKRASYHQDNRTPVRHFKCVDHRSVNCIAGVSFASLCHSKFFKSPIIQFEEKVMRHLVRIVLSIFVAALIVQTTAISKSFADCPPNCRKGNQSAPPASPPPSNPPPK